MCSSDLNRFTMLMSAERVAFGRGMYDECETLLDRMALVQPEAVQTHNLRGDVLQKRNRFREAHQEYAQCIEGSQPCDFWARDSRSNQAWCSLQSGDPEGAVADYRPVMDCEGAAGDGSRWAQFAFFLFSASDLDEADRAAQTARRLLGAQDKWVSMLDGFKLPRPVIIESREQQVDYQGRLVVRGILRNQSSGSIGRVLVQGEGFDDAGKVIATGKVLVEESLLAGMTTAFKVELEGVTERVVRCDARVIAFE